MKKDIHPSNYRPVVFKDMSNEYMFLGKSCANTKDSVKWEDGNEYPLVKLDISHTSHPFYTGKMMLVDTAGRVDKFKKRFAKHNASTWSRPSSSSLRGRKAIPGFSLAAWHRRVSLR
jgi:large subunit ribosomal protein L31